jgi:hypothetical protein
MIDTSIALTRTHISLSSKIPKTDSNFSLCNNNIINELSFLNRTKLGNLAKCLGFKALIWSVK